MSVPADIRWKWQASVLTTGTHHYIDPSFFTLPESLHVVEKRYTMVNAKTGEPVGPEVSEAEHHTLMRVALSEHLMRRSPGELAKPGTPEWDLIQGALTNYIRETGLTHLHSVVEVRHPDHIEVRVRGIHFGKGVSRTVCLPASGVQALKSGHPWLAMVGDTAARILLLPRNMYVTEDESGPCVPVPLGDVDVASLCAGGEVSIPSQQLLIVGVSLKDTDLGYAALSWNCAKTTCPAHDGVYLVKLRWDEEPSETVSTVRWGSGTWDKCFLIGKLGLQAEVTHWAIINPVEG